MKNKIYLISLILLFICIINSVYATEETNTTGNGIINEKDNTPILETENLNMEYHDGTYFTAKTNYKNEINQSNHKITFEISGITYEKFTDVNGEAKLKINLNPGKYKIITKHQYEPDYKELINENTIIIEKIKTSISSESNIEFYFKEGTYTSTLYDSHQNPIKEKEIKIYVNGGEYKRITDNNGKIFLKINLNPKTYEIRSYFEGDLYYKDANSILTEMRILKNETKIIAENQEVYYRNGMYTIKLIDKNKNPLKDKNIIITISGINYYRTTDAKGIANVKINLIPGTYYISNELPEDIHFKGSNNHSILIVKPIKISLNGKDINSSFGEKPYYYLKLSDVSDEGIAEKEIKTEIWKNNEIIFRYSNKTLENGIIKIPINLKPGKYKIKSTFEEMFYENKTIENKIIINKSKTNIESKELKLNRKGEYLELKLKNIDINHTIANKQLKITIDGVNYIRTSDDEGNVKLKINLRNGNFTYTYKFDEDEEYYGSYGINRFERSDKQINSEIIPLTKEITRKGNSLNILLVDENKIPLKNQNLKIEIDGVNYTRLTNDKGIANLKINLRDGYFKIISYFEGNHLFNKTKTISYLNIDKKIDLIYSFDMEGKHKFMNKKTKKILEIEIYRIITVNISNKLYTFNKLGNLDDINENLIYFIPFDDKIEYLHSEEEINKPGISIEPNEDNILIKYYSKLSSNLNEFNVIFDNTEIGEYNGEQVDIILNGNLEAIVQFTSPLIDYEDIEKLNKLNIPFDINEENSHTKLETKHNTIERTIKNSFGEKYFKTINKEVPYETIESFHISSKKITDEDMNNIMYTYEKFNRNYTKLAYYNYFLSVFTNWMIDKTGESTAENYNVSLNKYETIVLAINDWTGLSIDSKLAYKAEGLKNNTERFYLDHGILSSLCEKTAIELTGQESQCAVSEIFYGILKGEPFTFEKDGEKIILKLLKSTSYIEINNANGVTSAYESMNVSQLNKNKVFLKGAHSTVPISNTYINDISYGFSTILKSLKHETNNVLNVFNIKGNKIVALRGIVNELEAMGLVALKYVPTVISKSFGILCIGIIGGKATVYYKNNYAPENSYQYFSYHEDILTMKVVKIYNPKTGYYDTVEVPYNEKGEYNIENSTYIDSYHGKRNMTLEEQNKLKEMLS